MLWQRDPAACFVTSRSLDLIHTLSLPQPDWHNVAGVVRGLQAEKVDGERAVASVRGWD